MWGWRLARGMIALSPIRYDYITKAAYPGYPSVAPSVSRKGFTKPRARLMMSFVFMSALSPRGFDRAECGDHAHHGRMGRESDEARQPAAQSVSIAGVQADKKCDCCRLLFRAP
jgi:hypothetical protein